MRKRLFIFIGLIVSLLVIIFGVLRLVSRDAPVPEEQPDIPITDTLPDDPPDQIPDTPVQNNQGPLTIQADREVVNSEEQFKFERINQAKEFAARFGTFSNQNPYANLQELQVSSSVRLKGNLERQIKPANPFVAEYFGVTSRALAARFVEYESGANRYRIMVSLQRQEIADTEERVYNQDILITEIEENGSWVVDQAIWR